jgi:putative protein-disulfide isomerase
VPLPGEGEAQASPCVAITYFTDPLCCWSWAFEPQWRRLRFAFAGRLAWRIRMGGMIENWTRFSDPANAVFRPAQMGPVWLDAGRASGMSADPRIWVNDPPASSWPAGLAVKAAELQSAGAADLLLRRLREAVMAEGRNIARREVILAVAEEAAAARPDLLDLERFRQELDGADARAAFLDDVKETRFRGITHFPLLAIGAGDAAPVVLAGRQSYPALLQAVLSVAPDLGPERRPESPAAYQTYWGRVTAREIQEVAPDGAEAGASAPQV